MNLPECAALSTSMCARSEDAFVGLFVYKFCRFERRDRKKRGASANNNCVSNVIDYPSCREKSAEFPFQG